MDKSDSDRFPPLSPDRAFAGRGRLPDAGSVESSCYHYRRPSTLDAKTRVIRRRLPCRAPGCSSTGDEGRAVEALADCIIPPDPQTTRRQGFPDPPYSSTASLRVLTGRQDGLYVRPPFMKGTKSQGLQSEKGPAQEYREGLAALDRACKVTFGGKAFADLSDQDKDAVLKGLESGEFKLDGADGKAFFEQTIKDVQMGFFSPIRSTAAIATWSRGR